MQQDISRPLKFTAWLIIGFGAFMAAAVLPPIGAVLNWLTDLVLWPLDGAQHMAAPAARLLVAIVGGIMVGWGSIMLMLSGEVARSHPQLVRRIAIRGYLIWYAIDSAGSVLAGAPWNVLGNTLFLALLLVPFWMMGRQQNAGEAAA